MKGSSTNFSLMCKLLMFTGHDGQVLFFVVDVFDEKSKL